MLIKCSNNKVTTGQHHIANLIVISKEVWINMLCIAVAAFPWYKICFVLMINHCRLVVTVFIYLSRSLFSYFNYLVSVTASGPRSPRGHM